jgi:6-phosphogluconolactonase
MNPTGPWQVYVASSSGECGLWRTALRPDSREIAPPEPLGGPAAASFVRADPRGVVYATCDATEDARGLTGRLHAYATDPAGELVEMATRRTEGTTPCFISLAPGGDRLYVANFRGTGPRTSAGSATVFEVDAEGMPAPPAQVIRHAGSSVHPERQTNPHFHCVVPHPSGEFVLMTDLGIDALVLYAREELHERPLAEVDRAETPAGSGPRHAAFSPDGRFAFIVHEMSNDVASYRVHSEGRLGRVASVSALPADFAGDSAAADLHVHPSGRFLYASHRGHDSVAVLQVDEQGRPHLVRCVPAGGGNPRSLALTPDGRFLVVASAEAGRLTVLRIDNDTGDLEMTGQAATVASPVCVDVL